MAKYIFVTGGVVSSLGKGITAASIGRVLKNRGLKVFSQKFDPYINVDPGTMSPYQHGEVFVTTDGKETDLDLGHYERFIDEELNKNCSVTAGLIYSSVINKERRGDYLGGTVQVIPHITNEIKNKIFAAAKTSDADVVITEIGGTIGDIESLPFIETIRQVRSQLGKSNVLFIHMTLLPYLSTSHELKTKPTQHSVKDLRSYGIQPDILVCRTNRPFDSEARDKLALFCDVDKRAVVEMLDVKHIYEIPLGLVATGIDDYICEHLELKVPKADMREWEMMIEKIKNLKNKIKIALVGKYVSLPDAYLSVTEALKHGGYANDCEVEIELINSETTSEKQIKKQLADVDGILVPGGFGGRGIEGKITAIQYARENKIPFLGICLGMQLATIEFARNVCNLKDANSAEWDEITNNPIISLMPDQDCYGDLGGTLRLGNYPCVIKEASLTHEIYQKETVLERHRHRYEFNNKYRDILIQNGMDIVGVSPDNRLVEMVELKDHPWFIAGQFHPEFGSRPNKPHPLFTSFIEASLKTQSKR